MSERAVRPGPKIHRYIVAYLTLSHLFDTFIINLLTVKLLNSIDS